MKIVLQRVLCADLKVDGKLISQTGKGLVVYFGVGVGDDASDVDLIVRKISNLRIFEDSDGKMNLSIRDVGGEILFVSQFTLYGDVRKGNRPSFSTAELPEKANALYELAFSRLVETGITVKKGIFGADMKINQLNDGPVTIIFETPPHIS